MGTFNFAGIEGAFKPVSYVLKLSPESEVQRWVCSWNNSSLMVRGFLVLLFILLFRLAKRHIFFLNFGDFKEGYIINKFIINLIVPETAWNREVEATLPL